MESTPLLDCAGRRRSPATLPGYHQGRPPRNKGLQIRQTLLRLRRSSRSCAPPAMTRTASDSAG
jgi:hypothetical protein